MINKEILIDKTEKHRLVAVREDGKLVDFFFDFIDNKKSYPYLTPSSLKLLEVLVKEVISLCFQIKRQGSYLLEKITH